MLIGYARVSTIDQTLALRRDALKAAGCERIFTDKGISGTIADRPGLRKALAAVTPGDTLIVWKLDRFGRSLAHLVRTIAELGKRGVNFRSLSDPIDTTSAGGRLEHLPCLDAENPLWPRWGRVFGVCKAWPRGAEFPILVTHRRETAINTTTWAERMFSVGAPDLPCI